MMKRQMQYLAQLQQLTTKTQTSKQRLMRPTQGVIDNYMTHDATGLIFASLSWLRIYYYLSESLENLV